MHFIRLGLKKENELKEERKDNMSTKEKLLQIIENLSENQILFTFTLLDRLFGSNESTKKGSHRTAIQ